MAVAACHHARHAPSDWALTEALGRALNAHRDTEALVRQISLIDKTLIAFTRVEPAPLSEAKADHAMRAKLAQLLLDLHIRAVQAP